MALKLYNKKLDYSYTYGVYPTIDLFKKIPDKIIKVVLNPKGDKNEGLPELEDLCGKYRIPYYYSNKDIEKISAKNNTYAIGVFKKYEMEIEKETNHVVLVEPTNTGNLGTIVRAMSGFDVNNLAIIRPAVDFFEPKVIRASMGSFFNVKIQYFDSFEEYSNKHPHQEIYPFVLKGKKDLAKIKFLEPFSIVMGNESSGLPESFEKMENSVKISHSGEIDSLNLSMATTIALFHSYSNKE